MLRPTASLLESDQMSLEVVPIVLTLTFFSVFGLVGGLLVQDRRDQPPRRTNS